MLQNSRVTIIGAGLAGCEAVWQLAQAGVAVRLVEMKPEKRSPAHTSDDFAELVCSNSLKSARLDTAAGLLKEEMRCLGSLLLACADECQVEAGGALAVDRGKFSALVTAKIKSHPKIEIQTKEAASIPADGIVIIATGPLTSGALADEIATICPDGLSFYDAVSPIVTAESIDMTHAFYAARYGKGAPDAYLNCPMNKDEYDAFYSALVTAQRAKLHGVDTADPKVYEGCMPVEVMAQRGEDTLRFGPMKPVGLRHPVTDERYHAVLQLRRENADGTLYNLVGFQTNLKFAEQKRVFGMIPALKNADYVRYGVMHRNTFLDSTRHLNSDFSLRKRPDLFFAGQITGVEGYMESAGSGILAGINAFRRLNEQPEWVLPNETMLGALSHYISDPSVKHFQPMGANFGILPPLPLRIRDKRQRYAALSERSLEIIRRLVHENHC